jgi:hypothetical protein
MIGQTCNDILESPLTITLRSAVFRQFVLLCRRLDLYDRELLAVDGSRIRQSKMRTATSASR